MLCHPLFLKGQEYIDCDRKFIFHLVEKKYFDEAIFVINSKQCNTFLNNDSIEYLRGWTYYNLNRRDSSISSLLKVSVKSPFYLKAHFYSAFQLADSGIYDRSITILQKLSTAEKMYDQLKYYEMAGVSLLNGDNTSFENLIKQSENNQEISGHIIALRSAMDGYMNHKNKSPSVAGLMSGLIPGAGKLYAGREGEALTSFLSVAGLGLVTWENYRHKGIKNFGTILSGAFLSYFYISNIYGSVFSIIVQENDAKEEYRKTVLFNLRVPLDSFFR